VDNIIFISISKIPPTPTSASKKKLDSLLWSEKPKEKNPKTCTLARYRRYLASVHVFQVFFSRFFWSQQRIQLLFWGRRGCRIGYRRRSSGFGFRRQFLDCPLSALELRGRAAFRMIRRCQWWIFVRRRLLFIHVFLLRQRTLIARQVSRRKCNFQLHQPAPALAAAAIYCSNRKQTPHKRWKIARLFLCTCRKIMIVDKWNSPSDTCANCKTINGRILNVIIFPRNWKVQKPVINEYYNDRE